MPPYRSIDVTPYLNVMGDAIDGLGLRPAKIVYVPDGPTIPDAVFQASTGPLTVSTVTDVAIPYRAIWDVNQYYQNLGFTFPFEGITRGDLGRAYHRINGDQSMRATYALKQLVNKKFREHYDKRPLGEPVDDYWLWLRVQRIAREWAMQQTQDTGIPHTSDDFLRNIGIELPSDDEEEPEEETSVHTFAGDGAWPFGYYLWRSRRYDDVTLSEWQSMLIAAFAGRGLRAQIAVGYVGDIDDPWVIKTHNKHTVLFLNDSTKPTLALATELADYYATTLTPKTPGDSAMTTTEDADLFMTGGSAAQDQAETDRAARKAGFDRPEYLTSILAKSADSGIFRFLMDDQQFLRTQQHAFVTTKNAPADKPADVKWPEKMGAVCRYTKRADKVTTWYNDCYICDHMLKDDGKKYFASPRVWALLAVRKEVLGTQDLVDAGKIPADRIGMRVGIIDDIVEVDEIGQDGKPTGNKVKRKHFVIANMGIKNFFAQFVSFYQTHGTLLDRDYKITRRGEGTESDYHAVALDPLMRGGELFDLRVPKFMAVYDDEKYNINRVRAIAREQASDEYYGRFFDRRITTKYSDRDDSTDAASAGGPAEGSSVSEPTDQGTKDRLAAMRNKVMGDNPVQTSEQPAQAPAETPATEAATPTTEPAAATTAIADEVDMVSSTPTSSLIDFSD